jgi:hypothetical protein
LCLCVPSCKFVPCLQTGKTWNLLNLTFASQYMYMYSSVVLLILATAEQIKVILHKFYLHILNCFTWIFCCWFKVASQMYPFDMADQIMFTFLWIFAISCFVKNIFLQLVHCQSLFSMLYSWQAWQSLCVIFMLCYLPGSFTVLLTFMWTSKD